MEKSLLVSFGKRLQEKRREQGHSQEAFAKLCKVDRRYMGRVESGQVNVTLLKVYLFAEMLGVDVCDLLVDK